MNIGTPSTKIVRELEAHGSDLSLAAAKELRQQYHRATNAEYFKREYYGMLGPVARSIADGWEKEGVTRVHIDWGSDAPFGEDRAVALSKFMGSPRRVIGNVDND